MKDLKSETIKKLEELKKKISYDTEENYCNVVNILIDYDNEAQDDLYLYDTARELVDILDEELLECYLDYQFKTFGTERLFYITQALEHADIIYKVNGYGNLENVDNEDITYIIDETIDKLKKSLEEEDETANN